MFRFLRAKPSEHDQEILDRISRAHNNGYSSMRVDRNGSMVVDIKDIMNDKAYQDKTEKAHTIVSRA